MIQANPRSPLETSSDRATSRADSLYTVNTFDVTADPAKNLAETIQIAETANKRMLLQVGGEWCGWRHKLDRYIADHSTASAAIRDGFVIMKVNFSDENRNEAFLARYPSIPGYPHLFVLEGDGTLLHSQNTAELEERSSYNEDAILEFAKRWKA